MIKPTSSGGILLQVEAVGIFVFWYFTQPKTKTSMNEPFMMFIGAVVVMIVLVSMVFAADQKRTQEIRDHVSSSGMAFTSHSGFLSSHPLIGPMEDQIRWFFSDNWLGFFEANLLIYRR